MSAWRRLDGVLTPHARARMQQRGIAPRVVETLLDHGTVQHDHHGGRIVYFSRAVRRRLLRAGEVSAERLERWRQAYLVLTGDGRVRTAGWRYRRIRRH
jgi:hypothetical protein